MSTRRWIVAGLAEVRAQSTDALPLCPACEAAGLPTQPVPHLHHIPVEAGQTSTRAFVFDLYDADDAASS